MVTNYEGDDIQLKEDLPLLPIRDIVVYPFMILPLFVGRESSIKAVEHALEKNERLILLSSQKDISAENPSPSEIYSLGTVAMIMRMRKLPDGRIKILIQGLTKARITDFIQEAPFYKVKVHKIDNIISNPEDLATLALIRTAKEQLEKIISLGKALSPDILMVLEDIQDPGRLADLISSNLGLKVIEAQMILETLDPVERLHNINQILARELEVLGLQSKMRSQQREDQKGQKDFFLREQIKAIKSELGEDSREKQDEFSDFREKIHNAKMPDQVQKEAFKQLNRLEKMHPDSSESSIIRTYLECLLDLPWSTSTLEDLNLDKAKKILDQDHFDLRKVKERVLEYLAVRGLKGKEMKGPILCFIGPPGVGKTSLGKSIAKAIGREFVRLSLGGVKDEAEIRGHRRTYVGAMPGRFIQALQQARSNNPVIMLDEVDKLGSDFRGDPSSALLEVLDPEQNNSFRDHYLNVPFDLSNTMFIATANVIENIPGPLRDRMEILSLSGYALEEKLAISQKYLIPKQLEENGIQEDQVHFLEDGVRTVVENYTAEAGLRNLERKIGSLCRKIARKVVSGDFTTVKLTKQKVIDLLGPPKYLKEDEKNESEVGVATGLAWTAVGGEILYIEATLMKGKGLTLTGSLGDVMKESAQAAIGHIRSHAKDFNIDETIFEENEIHIHIPSGATPKDGPSAGITLATALTSLLTGFPIDHEVAMTGEITLTGKVLPIGGLKEKALAAMRHGIKKIIIPWRNKKDLVEISEEYRDKVQFIPVKHFSEVLEVALIRPKKKKQQKSQRKRLPDAAA